MTNKKQEKSVLSIDYEHDPDYYVTQCLDQERLVRIIRSDDFIAQTGKYEFIFAEQDAEALANVIIGGGSCVSLGNRYSFDTKIGILTISNEETGAILRQIKVMDNFALMIAITT